MSVTLRTPPDTRPEPVALPGARDGRDPARAIKRGPSRLPAELVAATQRDRLYDALASTVAQHGYANATVTDICRAAGVTRPAFYVHFDSKEGAFLATYRHGTEVLFGMMERAYQEAPDWPAATESVLRALLEVLAGAPAFATMAIVEIDAVGGEARHERGRLLRRFRQMFAEAPRSTPGDVPADVPADQLVDAVIGGIYSAIYRVIDEQRTEQLPELLPALTYFVLTLFPGVREPSGRPGKPAGRSALSQRPAAVPNAPLFRRAEF
jgi:AcrR family transcriptional regulator